MPQRIEDGDAAYLLVRVGRIDPERGIAYVGIPKTGMLPHEWIGWSTEIVSLKLLARAPEPRDFYLPRDFEKLESK